MNTLVRTRSSPPSRIRTRTGLSLSLGLSKPGWAWVAAVCAAVLLFNFARAVQLVVSQGQQRRVQVQLMAETAARCNMLATTRARADCRAAAP